VAKQSLHSLWIGSDPKEKRREAVAQIMKTESPRVVIHELAVIVRVRQENAGLDSGWAQMIFDKHVGDTWLLAV
jgi:hypothetical protein